MPLFLWMPRRSSGMHQRTPNSWASRPPRSVCCEMLTRDAPRASIDGRRDSNACKSRLHAGHHAGVECKEQQAVPEQRFRRDLDAAVVPQSKGRRAIARLERALGLSCRDQVFGRAFASHPQRRACLLRRRTGSRRRRVLAFPHVRSSVSPRWSVTRGKLGSGWSRAVVVAGNFELFAQVMTGRACAGSRFQRRVRRRRSVRRCPRADAG